MTNPAERKAALRRHFLELSRSASTQDREQASAEICRHLRNAPWWPAARSILAYAPLPGEPDIWPLVKVALAEERIVALPRFDPEQGRYAAGVVADALAGPVPGRYGILEPRADAAVLPLNGLEVVFVPGLAFSKDGYRLGRGKGYYDRLLAEIAGLKCGIAFDFQVGIDLPVEPHDVRLDYIATPTRLLAMRDATERKANRGS